MANIITSYWFGFQRKAGELLPIGIAYAAEPERAIAAIEKALGGLNEVPSEPAPQVGIERFGDSAVNIGLRYWVPTRTYHEVRFRANLAIYRAVKEAGISIPFPQREVRMLAEAR